jgi:hypothetical protein
MGGYGSGGGGVYCRKRLTSECFRIPLKIIKYCFGALIYGKNSLGYIKDQKEVSIFYNSKGKDYNHTISLEYTPCNYGGERAWFVCPECCELFSVLYLIPGRVACRKCLNLNYPCQQKTWLDRQIAKQWKLKAKLEDEGRRPRYMHQKTYERIEEEIAELDGVIAGGMLRFKWLQKYLPPELKKKAGL